MPEVHDLDTAQPRRAKRSDVSLESGTTHQGPVLSYMAKQIYEHEVVYTEAR